MRIIIVSGGKIGKRLADLLSKEKNDVIIIEKDERLAEQLAREADALVLCGNATEKRVLIDADVERCDALLALSGDDKTNLAVCEIARSMGAPRVVARITMPESRGMFLKAGITLTEDTSTADALLFKQMLGCSEVETLDATAKGKDEIVKFGVPTGSKLAGRSIEALAKERIKVVYAERGGKLIPPKKGAKLKEGDVVVAFMPSKSKRSLLKLLR